MSLTKIIGILTIAWGIVYLAGSLAIGSLTDEGKAVARVAAVEMAQIENDYSRCLKMRYSINSQGQASSFAYMASSCGEEAQKFETGLIRAGFMPQQASEKVQRTVTETYQYMRKLLPPCEKGEKRLQVS